MQRQQRPPSPCHDPWEPALGRHLPDQPVLTSVEITVTATCNLRCHYCAVGEQLATRDPGRVPMSVLIAALDRVETLVTLSITGGEPAFRSDTVEGWVLPLLQYAHRRGLRTQLNTNLTAHLDVYRRLAPWVDVLHMSWNWQSPGEFRRVTGGNERLFGRILENARALADEGVFVSAESMMAPETIAHLGRMNRLLAQVGCRRHEVHPRYPVDFARKLPVLSLDEMQAGIERFLEERDPDLWVLFGTFPFLPCDPDPGRRALWRRVVATPNVTVRNDPDGRSRLNIDALTGEVRVADFDDFPTLGSVLSGVDLACALARWHESAAFRRYRCVCPQARCLGPNPIVARTYFPEVDFRLRHAIETFPALGCSAAGASAGHQDR